MEFFIHLLKSSGILLLFFLVYTVFLKKETFFTTNRWFLITGLITALLLPFITLKKMVDVEAPLVFNANAMVIEASEPVIANAPPLFDSFKVLLLIYSLGVIVFLTRFMLQLIKINTLTKESVAKKVRGFFHIQTTKPVAPFSFFNNIYFYPKQFNNNELQNIIAHEEVHAKELHTLDILLLETVFILQWFNPIIWFYKKIVKQNLEYLADAQACEKGSCKKMYQYLMLKQAAGHQHLEITTTFYNSLIKKRIVMLNQNQSKKMNAWKLMV
ncbi:MAG: M56 family peptidase, partial [Croceitalea sp.]|nr:M56 family peptidase [Croceitalea sp.]